VINSFMIDIPGSNNAPTDLKNSLPVNILAVMFHISL